jgi:hypothetical protein
MHGRDRSAEGAADRRSHEQRRRKEYLWSPDKFGPRAFSTVLMRIRNRGAVRARFLRLQPRAREVLYPDKTTQSAITFWTL